MTFATDERTQKAIEQFRNFDVDTQLAILWYGYLDIKDQVERKNATSEPNTAEPLYNQIRALPREEQLQAQRDIASGANSDISRGYTALSSSGKLDVWLKLAEGIENNEIIGVPSDYKLPEQTQDFVNTIKGLEFGQRIDFTRSVVIEMGAK